MAPFSHPIKNKRKRAMHFKWPLFNLLLIATVGAILRLAFVTELPWLEYTNFLHAHSHLAILGWGFLGLFLLLQNTFLPEDKRQKKSYKRIFYGALFSLWGMFIAFLLQNYGLFSIGFSTLFLLWSYAFVWHFWRDLPKGQTDDQASISTLFIRSALLFYLFSTLALWALPVINILKLHGHPIYYMSIQFFLHFQFNGWFLFAIPGLFFKMAEMQHIRLSPNDIRRYWQFLLISCFLTYALAVTWTTPVSFIFWINSLGVLLQLAALYFLLKALRPGIPQVKAGLSPQNRRLFSVALASYILKILIQTVVVIPHVAVIAYTVRNYVIGFIHLILLGVLTSFTLSYAGFRQIIPAEHPLTRHGVQLFVIAFVSTEILLFLQGTLFWANLGFLPYYYELLFAFSALLPISIGMILLGLVFSQSPLISPETTPPFFPEKD